MNAQSYDINMEVLPLFISYPRSGSNWVNAVLELYFDRPRLRAGPCTFLPNRDKRKDYMWFHDHDIHSDLKVKHNNILYLYRYPMDVVFSLMKAEADQITIQGVQKNINILKKHWEKYLLNGGAKTIIKYRNLKSSSYYDEFEKAIKFFKPDEKLDQHKLNDILLKVTKENMEEKEVDKRYFNKYMLSTSYVNERKDFYEQYHSLFDSVFMSEPLLQYY